MSVQNTYDKQSSWMRREFNVLYIIHLRFDLIFDKNSNKTTFYQFYKISNQTKQLTFISKPTQTMNFGSVRFGLSSLIRMTNFTFLSFIVNKCMRHIKFLKNTD